MGWIFAIDAPTKGKIKRMVEAGQFLILSNDTVKFCKEKNYTMFKESIDRYYDQVFTGIEQASNHHTG